MEDDLGHTHTMPRLIQTLMTCNERVPNSRPLLGLAHGSPWTVRARAVVGNHEFYADAQLRRYLDQTWQKWGPLDGATSVRAWPS